MRKEMLLASVLGLGLAASSAALPAGAATVAGAAPPAEVTIFVLPGK